MSAKGITDIGGNPLQGGIEMDAVVSATQRPLFTDRASPERDATPHALRQAGQVSQDPRFASDPREACLNEMMTRARTIAVVTVQVSYVHPGEAKTALDLLA